MRIAHERWPTTGLPGELPQVLPTPRHFAQAAELVTPEMVSQGIVCGPDPDAHLEMIATYADAGFDELYVANTGPHYAGFFELYAKRVLPDLDSA